jgi:drug/metabolite transporter (DMT)-like permease
VVLAALIAVTAVWGVTFVQVKDAVEIYPLFAFLAVRFAIASATLAVPAAARLRALGRSGLGAGALLGLLLGAGYALQTAGLERTSVSGTGFITGMYVVLTPLIALMLFRSRIGAAAWAGVALSTTGLVMLAGIHGSAGGDLLVLAGAGVYSLQIVLMERYAPRYDALAFTLVEMAAAGAGLVVVALALGELGVPRGWTVWGALLVTGIFASALAFLVQTWAQRRTSATRTALAFAMEPVFAALFGYTLAGDRLGAAGWSGCAAIMGGIVLAEPAAAAVLVSAVARTRRSRSRWQSGGAAACPRSGPGEGERGNREVPPRT